MANHPNRGARGASSNPPPEQILEARNAAGLTQTQAAELVHATCRRWQEWEAGDYRMHPGLFELFMLKTRQAKLPRAVANG
ncbi:XRE family transcriptional regulator [Metapseudomonas otitidis]|uniref:XRE family transcriptional regulator n=1 Tax=Metapseudomonas otitidis TaxID=319939 RepID=UPI0039FCF16F